MDLLRAVGLVAQTPQAAVSGRGAARPSALATGRRGSDAAGQRPEVPTLPDVAVIAKATERGILAREEEARGLERKALADAIAVVESWVQGLRRKPRRDEPLASFRVEFLRGNALERAVQALRRNQPVWRELTDRPLFGSSPLGVGDAGKLKAQLTDALKLSLPRAAASLAEPLMTAVLFGDQDCAAAALATARVLREDWTEVVQMQALRNLERQLDTRNWELQKTPSAEQGKRAPEMLKSAHDRVLVLAELCKGLEEAQKNHEKRSADVCRSLQAMGLDISSSAYADTTAGTLPIAGRHARAGLGVDTAVGASGLSAPALPPVPKPEPALISDAQAEAAVTAMLLATESGMLEGLRILGLPHEPLHFVQELRVCGVDIRPSVQALLAHWVVQERDEFFGVLQRIRLILGDGESTAAASQLSERSDASEHGPGGAGRAVRLPDDEQGLAKLRADLLEERTSLEFRLREVNERLRDVDARLASVAGAPGGAGTHDPWSPVGSTHCPSSSSSAPPPGPPDDAAAARSARSVAPSSTSRNATSLAASAMPPDLLPQVAGAAEALSVETLRDRERLVEKLQRRRAQLFESLGDYLRGERGRLEQLAASMAGVVAADRVPGGPSSVGAVAELREQATSALREARWLCSRVEVVSGGSGELLLGERPRRAAPAVGDRCRARWMDGNYYDATVQKVPGDGTIVVNWLRPRPLGVGDASPAGKPLLTVSEKGGDDTLHRIVQQEDVQVVGPTATSPTAKDAFRQFDARSPEDKACVDCSADGADWASISFGVYLCQRCAEEHLGIRTSLVRELHDGWGWNKQELQYLVRGGNAAFLAQVERYPAVKALAAKAKYVTRFAEHYRRHLDALCSGTPPPASLPADVAAEPAADEFLGAAEAVARVRRLAQEFETAVEQLSVLDGRSGVAILPASTPPRKSGAPGSQPQKFPKVAVC